MRRTGGGAHLLINLPGVNLKPPSRFSEGKPESASEARPEVKNSRVRRPQGLLAEGLAKASDLPEGKSEYRGDHPMVNLSRQPLRISTIYTRSLEDSAKFSSQCICSVQKSYVLYFFIVLGKLNIKILKSQIKLLQF